MEVNKLRKVYPGEEINEHGHKGTGILHGKATIYGDLVEVKTTIDKEEKKFVFVNSKTNLYIPQQDDIVIGKVIQRTMDFYRIDLGQSSIGFLPALNFPNATKRNKPELNVGEYVISRIINVGEECVLYCSDGLGKICDTVVNVPVWKIRLLFVSDHLKKLGDEYKFNIGLGMNGKVFIDCEDPEVTQKIIQCLLDIE